MRHHFASARLWVGVRWCHTLMNYGERFQKGCLVQERLSGFVRWSFEGEMHLSAFRPFSNQSHFSPRFGRVIATCLRRFHVTSSHRHRLNLTLLWCLYLRLEILSLLHRCNSGWWKTNPRWWGRVGETGSSGHEVEEPSTKLPSTWWVQKFKWCH